MDDLSVIHPVSVDEPIPFGVHLMIDGYIADGAAMNDIGAFKDLLSTLPKELGMHIIAGPEVVEVGPNCVKDPGGLSGFVMIAESHISFHTFPARGFVTIDLYTCQNDVDTEQICARLIAAFGINDADVFLQNRGLRYPVADIQV